MTVAACLIVKNEAAVIGRCLDSVRGLVAAAVVVDTGSTDDTPAAVRRLALPFPVYLHERPWVHFAHNRTELLRLAAPVADYLLLLDADQTVAGRIPPLTADGYHLRMRRGPLLYENLLLVRAALPWRYEGAVHEYLTCDGAAPPVLLDSLTITDHNDGGNRPAGTQPRWERDAEILERELAAAPGHPRNTFYLARSYDDLATTRPDDPRAAEWRDRAVARYRERAAMTAGYADEAFYSLFRLGVLRLDAGDGLAALLEAWERRPHRWEPVHAACRWLNQRGLYRAAYALSSRALADPPRPAGLFVLADVYDHLLAFEHGIAAYYVGAYRESYDGCAALLAKALPPNIEAAVRRNIVFPRDRLGLGDG
jgi:glycosyltransferase involved in cell wall biosynthesis